MMGFNMDGKNNLPKHIAIIPDGNRRWARARNKAPWQGHIAGARMFGRLAKTALKIGVPCLSFWGGSWDNLTKRPEIEVRFIFKIYTDFAKKLLNHKDIHKNQVKVSFIGRWRELLPEKTKNIFTQVMEKTKNYEQHFLNFLIAYNGTDEMLCAIKDIIKDVRKSSNFKIDGELLKQHLWTRDLPAVDFLIRTGSSSDPHNSNGFMMWETTDSQFCFAKEFFPDFNEEAFLRAIKEYQRRERRMGK